MARDGTAEPVSRDQILRHARGQGNINFPCSAYHEQDWQPYPVDPYSAICNDHTYARYLYTVRRIQVTVQRRTRVLMLFVSAAMFALSVCFALLFRWLLCSTLSDLIILENAEPLSTWNSVIYLWSVCAHSATESWAN